jgi:hypothetical protein
MNGRANKRTNKQTSNDIIETERLSESYHCTIVKVNLVKIFITFDPNP